MLPLGALLSRIVASLRTRRSTPVPWTRDRVWKLSVGREHRDGHGHFSFTF